MIKSKSTKFATTFNRMLPLLLAFLFGAGAFSAHAGSIANKMIKVSTEEDAQGVTHFYVHNNEAAEVTATFELKLKNLACSTNLPFTRTYPGNQTVEAFALKPVTPGQPWDFSYNDCFTIGNNNAVHDDDFVYQLPYKVGKSYRVTQGYHGVFSHTGPDEYAIDFKMPIGTPVYAARGGIVVKVKDDSTVGGPERKFEDEANLILIQHSDETIGIYAHLKAHGARVKVGDHVNAGDCIALSGNTGFTSGPHLHFSVFKTRTGRERVSLPVRFQTARGVAATLAEGESYKSAAISEVQVAKAPTTQITTTQ